MKKLFLTLIFVSLLVSKCFAAIYYLDYENGDDSNDGSSWANAWKTITSGATAIRIAPGDIIRIAKSPAPVSIGDATWTNLSKTVTLTSAQTATIELCETAWVASTNVTATTSSTEKEGNYSASLAIGSDFTTGKVAYKSFTTLDLSAYQKISLWIRNSIVISANYLKVVLCSDTTGDTIVDTFYIPAIPSTNRYLPLTLTKDGGGNLGSSIQSIAVYADTDPMTPTLLLDNIIACTTNGLNLQSLISKNSSEQGGTEGWYGIQSIVGITVKLDTDTNREANSGRGYSGTTETITTYKRETIKTAMASSSTKQVQAVQDSGTSGNNIEFQGGWDTATTVQDGETFFDGLNGYGYGIYVSGKHNVTFNHLNVCRYYTGIVYYNNSCNNTIDTLTSTNNNSSVGIYYNSSHHNTINNLINVSNNSSYGISFGSAQNNTIITLTNLNNNNSYGIYFYSSSYNKIKTISNARNNYGYAIYFASHSSNNYIYSLSTEDNSSKGIINGYGRNYLFNALIAEAQEVGGLVSFVNSRLFSQKHDQTADNHIIFTDGGQIHSEGTVRHTALGIAWRLDVTSANRNLDYPLDLKIARVACTANNQVTVKTWFRRSNTGLTMKLVCRGKQIAGVDNDVIDEMTAAADTWEELSISFTPTEAGVVEIEAWAYGGITYSGYVDDMTITVAGGNPTLTNMDYVFQAQPAVMDTGAASGGDGGSVIGWVDVQ
ncbi:MAG: hypothetical protein DRP74_02630 [Candidatus Omnitrophota bacterium]|nr:MAG: hypothetical protein DRP74_02630 [Candidatus Omnitrophota bacterium]